MFATKTAGRAASVLLALSLWLGACGAPAPADNATASAVSYMVFGDPAELKAYHAVAEAFEQQHPNVAVEVIHIPGASDYRARVNADIAAGIPADIVLINYRRMAGYAAKNQFASLNNYIAQSTVLQASDFYPQAYDAFNWNGQQMCIPQNISSLVVYYNKDLFKAAGVVEPQAGWTWAQFVETAQALTRDTDGDGAVDQYGLGTETTFIRLMPFIWQKGGDVMTKSPARLALNSVPASQAFQWFVDWRLAYGIVPPAEEEESENSESRFINGRLGMYLDSRRIVPALRDAMTADWDVAPLPTAENGQRANILHGDGYCIPAAAQHKDLAWKFVEFANSSEGQKIVAATGRTVPSNIAVAQSEVFLNPNVKPAHSQVWLDEIPHVRALPLVPNWAGIELVADDEVTRAYYGAAPVEDAVIAAISRSEEYFVQQP
jgi:multiple sugar transport system substrate-binding protein